MSEIVYEYDTEDEGRRVCERDTQDHYHEIGLYPLNQYDMYLDDGGRRRYVHTDTGDERFYSNRQPGLQLEDGNWSEDYNYIRPHQSSIRDEAYRAWYETTHPRPYTLDGAIHLSFDVTEDDIDNYLIRTALADNQLDTDATSSSSTDQRRVPRGKRTTTDEENIFFQRSLRTPRPIAGVTSNANIKPRR